MVSSGLSTCDEFEDLRLTCLDYRNARIEQLARQDNNDAAASTTTDPTTSREDGDADEELLLAGKRFDKDLHRIREYYRTLVRTQVAEGRKDDEMELLRRKYALLIKYDAITAFEGGLDT